MDQQKLRSLVFEKTGVKIDIDDPVFALVALNEAVLAETVERHLARIDAASQQLVQHALTSGGLAASSPADTPAPYAPAPAAPVRAIATQSTALTAREMRLLGAAAAVALLSSLLTALLVLGAQAAYSKPAPAPALTPAQRSALEQAEKRNQAIQQLDPKLRAQLPAALQN